MGKTVRAKVSFIRITPRKLGLICDEIRGMPINKALAYLSLSPAKRICSVLEGVLKSAVANADQKGTMDLDQLVLSKLLVGKGPTLKRFRPRAKGAASPILKYTSHVSVELAEKR